MKKPQAVLACLCMLGAGQPTWSQVTAPTAPAIPGYLDPATGKFSTKIASAANVQTNTQAQPAVAGTGIFFREDFQVQIQNYDQPANATATCTVEMSNYGDANGYYNESATVAATASGGGWSCDVPILTYWTLQNPTANSISASVTVTIYTQATPVAIGRSSTQSLTLAVPGNTQTAVNSVSFRL